MATTDLGSGEVRRDSRFLINASCRKKCNKKIIADSSLKLTNLAFRFHLEQE